MGHRNLHYSSYISTTGMFILVFKTFFLLFFEDLLMWLFARLFNSKYYYYDCDNCYLSHVQPQSASICRTRSGLRGDVLVCLYAMFIFPKQNTEPCSHLGFFKCPHTNSWEPLACSTSPLPAAVTYWAVWVTEWGQTADTNRAAEECLSKQKKWRLDSSSLILLHRSIRMTAPVSKLCLMGPRGVLLLYLEVSVRLAVWMRWEDGAAVWWLACRDIVLGSDLSSPAVGNTDSPLIHTGTAEGKQGDLQGRDTKKDNISYWLK